MHRKGTEYNELFAVLSKAEPNFLYILKLYVFIKLQDYKLVYVHYNEAEIILINKQLLQL